MERGTVFDYQTKWTQTKDILKIKSRSINSSQGWGEFNKKQNQISSSKNMFKDYSNETLININEKFSLKNDDATYIWSNFLAQNH